MAHPYKYPGPFASSITCRFLSLMCVRYSCSFFNLININWNQMMARPRPLAERNKSLHANSPQDQRTSSVTTKEDDLFSWSSLVVSSAPCVFLVCPAHLHCASAFYNSSIPACLIACTLLLHIKLHLNAAVFLIMSSVTCILAHTVHNRIIV